MINLLQDGISKKANSERSINHDVFRTLIKSVCIMLERQFKHDEILEMVLDSC